jgi:hypothetical protein
MLNPLSIQAVFLWGVVCSELFKFDEALEKFKIVIEHNLIILKRFITRHCAWLKKKNIKRRKRVLKSA